MRSLLVHADDFGMSDGVVSGILAALSGGIVTATSAMVCSKEDRARVARTLSRIPAPVGLHLQLTDGEPVSDPAAIASLLDPETGRFPRRKTAIQVLKSAEVLREWRAQFETFRRLGVSPAYLDTHHSVHVLPGAAEAYRELALETRLPVRGGDFAFNRGLMAAGIPCADAYVCPWTGGPVKVETLFRALRALARVTPEQGFVEICCHPALVDHDLRARSQYVEHRQDELAVLCRPGLEDEIRERGYRLAKPSDLARRSPVHFRKAKGGA